MSTELRHEVEALYPRRRQWFRRRKAIRAMESLEADLATFSGRPRGEVSKSLARALAAPFGGWCEFTFDVDAAASSLDTLKASGE